MASLLPPFPAAAAAAAAAAAKAAASSLRSSGNDDSKAEKLGKNPVMATTGQWAPSVGGVDFVSSSFRFFSNVFRPLTSFNVAADRRWRRCDRPLVADARCPHFCVSHWPSVSFSAASGRCAARRTLGRRFANDGVFTGARGTGSHRRVSPRWPLRATGLAGERYRRSLPRRRALHFLRRGKGWTRSR